jgi:hypothetical protein
VQIIGNGDSKKEIMLEQRKACEASQFLSGLYRIVRRYSGEEE